MDREEIDNGNILKANKIFFEKTNGFPYKQIIDYSLGKKVNVLVITTDLNSQELIKNLIKYITNTEYAFQQSNENYNNWDKIANSINKLKDASILIADNCKNKKDIIENINKFHKEYPQEGTRLVIIDNFYNIKYKSEHELDIIYNKISNISQKNNIPIILYNKVISYQIKDIILDLYEIIEKRYERFSSLNETEKRNLITNFHDEPKINALLKPLEEVLNIAAQNEPVIIFTPMVSKVELLEYLFVVHGKIELETLRTGNFTSKDWLKVATSMEKLSYMNLHIITIPILDPKIILEHCEKIASWYKSHTIGGIIIDYSNLIEFKDSQNVFKPVNNERKLLLENLTKQFNSKVIAIERDKI